MCLLLCMSFRVPLCFLQKPEYPILTSHHFGGSLGVSEVSVSNAVTMVTTCSAAALVDTVCQLQPDLL